MYVEVLGTKIADQERERIHTVEGCLEDDHWYSIILPFKQLLNTIKCM